MIHLAVYVPSSHLEKVKAALFAAGAGKIGNYDSCSWQTLGKGQFRPLENSQPTLGKLGQVETVDEWKLEMVCAKQVLPEVLRALHASHPYETPAYLVVELAN